jgi:hypothetical protein
MEPKSDLKPRLSVILPAMRGYETVFAALDAWEAQTCRNQLEIVVLCPALPAPGVVWPHHVVMATGELHLHQARAAAVERVAGDYVVFAEDHCLPDPCWAQTVLARMAEGWDAVGPHLRPGNRTTPWAEASFLLGYGQWMALAGGGSSPVVPGHDVVMRTSWLRDIGPDLERDLLVAAFLSRRLRREGLRLYLEDRAAMRHFDVPDGKMARRIFYSVGQGYGAVRAQAFPWIVRATYWLVTPAIAARHLFRALRQYARGGARAGLAPRCLPATAVLAVAWACGESVGALRGMAGVAPRVAISEIKPVSRREAALLTND